MPLTFNGSVPDTIVYNGNDVQRVICNGVTVWEKDTGNSLQIMPMTVTASYAAAYTKPSKTEGYVRLLSQSDVYLSMPPVNGFTPIFNNGSANLKMDVIYWVETSDLKNPSTAYSSYVSCSRGDKIIMTTDNWAVILYEDSGLKTRKKSLPDYPLFQVTGEESAAYAVRCLNTGDTGYLGKLALTVLDLSKFDFQNYDNNA